MKRKRISLWIFPEGTRYLSRENDLLPFKKGAFYLAVQCESSSSPRCGRKAHIWPAELPIIPVVCQNYYHLYDSKTRFRRGTLRIKGESVSWAKLGSDHRDSVAAYLNRRQNY